MSGIGIKISALSVSLVATGVGVWFLRKSLAEQRRPRSGDLPFRWRQVPPAGPVADLQSQHGHVFGETDVQAKFEAERLPANEMRERARDFLEFMNMRRTMRFFSKDNPPAGVVEDCILTAGASPSGAHHQPWYFVIVKSSAIKQKIRELVEEEEKINYERRMRKSWIDDLSSMTGATADPRLKKDGDAPQKPYLTEAPMIMAMFKQNYVTDAEGKKIDNYYVNESCGIAAGIFITALHNVGLATLTSTPMGSEQAIREMLGRPANEKLFLLLPIGYPAADATVPYRTPLRKSQENLFATC